MKQLDWQLRLSEFVRTRAHMPFEWGTNDCCLFASDAVQAMTGDDHAVDLRGYHSALAAARVIEQHGGLRQIATDALGEPHSPVFATVGDVVLLENVGREMLAICNGINALAPGEKEMAVLSMDAALLVWKV